MRQQFGDAVDDGTEVDYLVWNELPTVLGNLVGGLFLTGIPLYLTHTRTLSPRDVSVRSWAPRGAVRNALASGTSTAVTTPAATVDTTAPHSEPWTGAVAEEDSVAQH